MEEITLKEAWQQILSYDSSLWFGLIGAIIIFIIEIILMKKKIIFSGFERKIEDARKNGRVISAKRISCRYNDRNPKTATTDRIWIAMYKYELNGKKKKYQVVSASVEPPYTIHLYYNKNASKVFSNYGKKSNPLIILIYIIPILVSFIILRLMGFNTN